MLSSENYVYQKEVDWSLLKEGITLPLDNQVVFSRTMNRFLQKGESKKITIIINGKSYSAKVTNVNFSSQFNHANDIVQIRYVRDGDLARALQACFSKSYQYLVVARGSRTAGDRRMIRLPDACKEYLAVYTTEYDDTFVFEGITAEEVNTLESAIKDIPEYTVEEYFNHDETSCILEKLHYTKIRKLNRKIGENLKLLYEYRCQICGQLIGAEYNTQIIEAHHIDYFINSHNNDSENQLIVCPNHHRIIHSVNPVFDRPRKMFIYDNGYTEMLHLNKHIV